MKTSFSYLVCQPDVLTPIKYETIKIVIVVDNICNYSNKTIILAYNDYVIQQIIVHRSNAPPHPPKKPSYILLSVSDHFPARLTPCKKQQKSLKQKLISGYLQRAGSGTGAHHSPPATGVATTATVAVAAAVAATALLFCIQYHRFLIKRALPRC